jgi:hypothetical protein
VLAICLSVFHSISSVATVPPTSKSKSNSPLHIPIPTPKSKNSPTARNPTKHRQRTHQKHQNPHHHTGQDSFLRRHSPVPSCCSCTDHDQPLDLLPCRTRTRCRRAEEDPKEGREDGQEQDDGDGCCEAGEGEGVMKCDFRDGGLLLVRGGVGGKRGGGRI